MSDVEPPAAVRSRSPQQDQHDEQEVAAWAASGCLALTGRRAGPPLGPPAGLVAELAAVTAGIGCGARALGSTIEVDGLALLGERAAIARLTRQGDTSCGGATRLLRASDGWVALSLARTEDLDLLPALLETGEVTGDPWDAVAASTPARPAVDLVERGRLLGLPIAVLAEAPATEEPASGSMPWDLPVRSARQLRPAAATRTLSDLVVVDLSSLWAGPLCGALLAAGGATVVKVESTARPDGGRRGPTAFFDLMNGGKLGVALDLRAAEGVATLRSLLERADVVIEASRPRALEQLGIDAATLVERAGPRVWISITGHGRTGPGRDRVAFGDDAAAAGGLVAWDERGPCFCADAIADPTTGLVATAAALAALAAGGAWLLDVSMVGVAAHLAGPTLPVRSGLAVAAPRARAARADAPRLGEHTAEVLARLGVTP